MPGLDGFDPLHYAAFFVLALLFALGLGDRARGAKGAGLVLLLCLAYGVLDEWHQSFVPGRTPDALDVRNDMIGAALAVGLTELVRRLRGKRRKTRD